MKKLEKNKIYEDYASITAIISMTTIIIAKSALNETPTEGRAHVGHPIRHGGGALEMPMSNTLSNAYRPPSQKLKT